MGFLVSKFHWVVHDSKDFRISSPSLSWLISPVPCIQCLAASLLNPVSPPVPPCSLSFPLSRAVASLTIPGGQEFHFPHFSSNFDKFFLFFLKLDLFSFLFWRSGWATRPLGKALATPLPLSQSIAVSLVLSVDFHLSSFLDDPPPHNIPVHTPVLVAFLISSFPEQSCFPGPQHFLLPS